jgi:SnoaL-like domain
VIDELYTEDCTFFEADDQILGRDALNAKVEQILKEAPGFVFRLTGPAEVNHDHARLRWHFGPNGAAPVLTGMDVAVFKRGRICSLYAFLDKAPGD